VRNWENGDPILEAVPDDQHWTVKIMADDTGKFRKLTLTFSYAGLMHLISKVLQRPVTELELQSMIRVAAKL
jgi:hypothetical protein